MQEDAQRRFGERQAYWIGQGYSGRDVYSKLATDVELPLYYEEAQAAEIAGLTASAMSQRRVRKMEPSYIAHSRRSVRYPRHELCNWLASMFCDRSAS